MALLARWRRSRQDRVAALLVLGGLALFVAVVYVVVVLGGGVLVGRTSSPQLGLSVLATALVAFAFEPVRTRLERVASRTAHGGRPSPYDVLSRFSEQVTGSEQVPEKMARLLAEGTGARWAQVWLAVGEDLVLAATWPPDADADQDAPDRETLDVRGVLPVRHAGEVLGVLRLREAEDCPLTPVEERLSAGLAAQAGVVLHGARLRAELARQATELAVRAEELRMSRQRLVDAQDAARQRLERDIHDGAQQHLVALAVNLRLGQTLAERSPERAATVLAAQAQAAHHAITTLSDLARGIYPPLLRDEGLVAALREAVATSLVPVRLVAEVDERWDQAVEAALYFCCLEALQNVAKHSGAGVVDVRLSRHDGSVELVVADDGQGIRPTASATTGIGLTNMRDRLDSVGGRLTVGPGPHGTGLAVRATAPARPAVGSVR